MTAAPAISETLPINENHASSGGRLVAADGRELPLESASIEATAAGGVARVVLSQTFVNHHDQPLLVEYTLPLPAGGAVSGFSFRLGDRRIAGEIDRRAAARERFEAAIAAGQSAAILEQERGNTFTQEVGNIGAGETVICETIVDQRLVWLDEGMWEWRFPTVVGPRYLGAEGRVADADRVTVDVSADPLDARMHLGLAIGDELAGAVESASHSIRSDGARVSLAGARLDRDVAVRWPVATAEVGLSLSAARPQGGGHDAAYGLLTVVPPLPEIEMKPVPRDLIVLIDTSGSMAGLPLDQARRIVSALIDGLGERDRLELIEFSSRPRRWRPEPVITTAETRRAAIRWVDKLSAGGATEMREAILEAMRTLRPSSQRQVLLVTDGYIGFEAEVIEAACNNLPPGCRIHTLGVGSAVNQSLLGPVARAGGGVCAVAGLAEDVERASARLLARMNAPLVTDLSISGDAVVGSVPHQLPDLFAGAPALIGVKLRPEGGSIRVRGNTATGRFDHQITAPALEPGAGDPSVIALYGREQVEDYETLRAAGGRDDLDQAIERVGLRFQIATRLTSWVAVSDRVVDGERVREVMPHELPHGTSIEGFGLRPAAFAPMMAGAGPMMMKTRMSAPAGFAPMQVQAPSPARRGFPWLLWLALLGGLAVLVYLLWSLLG